MTTIANILSLPNWPALLAALALTALAAAVAVYRRIPMSRPAGASIAGGMLLLALACGGLTWHRPEKQEVAVMVDLSASTRTAQYRNTQALQQRIAQLLGKARYRLVYFAAENQSTIPASPSLPDLPGDQTVFNPPDAAAIVLFSDGQFALPAAAPPVYIAVDPMLEDPPDAAVRRLEINGQTLSATASNQSTQARQLTLSPDGAEARKQLGGGTTVFSMRLPPDAAEAAARLSPGDAWPENDALGIRIPPPAEHPRWWVGRSAPAGAWRQIDPAQLPTEPADYLAPALIVLDNLAAPDLSELQQQRLHQYVRDLGGSLAIFGGDRAFAAGAYPGTTLETLSPLSSTPPTPTLHWIILGDASGSMATSDGGPTRWEQAKQAMLGLLPKLPPEDPVTIGSFAESLRWWSQGKPARETAALPLPPADLRPNGPTNLEQALLSLIASADSAMPKELLLLSDCDAQIGRVDELRRGLIEKKIRLNVLALSETGRALKQLEELVQATGGQALRELNPSRWTEAIQKLYARSAPDRLSRQPVNVRFLGDLAGLPPRAVAPWNRTWLKKSATSLGEATSAEGLLAMAGRWNVGAGQVLSAAFSPAPGEIEAMARLIAQPPRDPRFKIAWQTGPQLRIAIDAVDGKTYLNDLSFSLDLAPSLPASHSPQPIPQTAPGRYERSLPAPRQPVLAAVRQGEHVLDRQAIAGRYAPEFDAIGNNLANLKELAARSGGEIIPPTQTKSIDFDYPRRQTPLTSWLACAGALLLAAGLIYWRL